MAKRKRPPPRPPLAATDRKKALARRPRSLKSKNYGKGAIMRLGRPTLRERGRSRSSLSLDLALGIGSVPRSPHR